MGMTFTVSDRRILTPSGLKGQGGSDWATHNRTGARARSQWIAPKLRKYQFDLLLRAQDGVNPRSVLRHFQRMAETNAAVIPAMFTVFVQPATATDDRPFGEMLPENMLIDAEDQGSVELGNGAIVGLNPGETVSFADPKHPNAGYDKFTEAMIKQIGAALEIPPEVISKQFSTSYSAARGALNEFWRSCDVQRDDFVDSFCQPIYEEWLAEAVARNRIKAPGFFQDPAIRKAYSGCAWPGPARTSLNPVQEISAATKRVEAGFSTAQEETAQMTGGNYNRNIRQRVAEAKRKREVDEIMDPSSAASEGGNGNV